MYNNLSQIIAVPMYSQTDENPQMNDWPSHAYSNVGKENNGSIHDLVAHTGYEQEKVLGPNYTHEDKSHQTTQDRLVQYTNRRQRESNR